MGDRPVCAAVVSEAVETLTTIQIREFFLDGIMYKAICPAEKDQFGNIISWKCQKVNKARAN